MSSQLIKLIKLIKLIQRIQLVKRIQLIQFIQLMEGWSSREENAEMLAIAVDTASSTVFAV